MCFVETTILYSMDLHIVALQLDSKFLGVSVLDIYF